jgi:YD repeat-containing protein
MKKTTPCSTFSRCVLALLTILFSQDAFAETTITLTDPSPNDPSQPRLDLGLLGPPHTTVPVQQSPTLDTPTWQLLDVLRLDATGSASTSVLGDPTMPTGDKHFFRAILPLPQISLLQPTIVSMTGGSFYVIGQMFEPSDTVRIDGILVSSTFMDPNTIFVSPGTLSAGFHTVTVLDSLSNIIASMPNGLTVTSTGRTDQVSPPSAPKVNDPNVGVSGPFHMENNMMVPDNPPSSSSGAPDPGDLPPGSYWAGGVLTLPRGATSNVPQTPSDPNVGLSGPFVLGGGPNSLMVPIGPPTGSTVVPPSDSTPWSRVYEFGPDGTTFANPSPIQLRFTVGTAVTDPIVQWSLPDGGYEDLDGDCSVAEPSSGPRCYVPDVWRIDPVPWNRDVAPQEPTFGWTPMNPAPSPALQYRLQIVEIPPSPEPKLCPLFAMPNVNEATGELFIASTDLVIPGRGLDLVWARTYRSKIGLDTAMGVGWDFSYNIRAAQAGANMTVQNGENRTDTYLLQSDGSFANDELFRRGTLVGNVFTLQFADKTRWVFRPLDGSPTAGKIAQIIDRNSNQMQFQYDGSGRLFLIIDTLSRTFQISYDGANRIQSVTDFTGRVIQYTHPTVVMPGIGGIGDLTLVRSQAVTGTPIGNDFPSGKVAQFTYSTGLGGARDHNLLTARDGNNLLWFQAIYTPTAVTTDFLFDRVSSRIVGTAGESKVFTYLPKTPTPANRFNTTKTIVNDAVGNVHESLFDSKNRLIDLKQFTGRSTPGVAVTESTNRPTGQLRMTDPPFFQATVDWNRDSLPISITLPRGNGVEMVYQRDFDASANPRERANLRVLRETPVTGAALVTRYEYESGFGTGEIGTAAFTVTGTDKAGNTTTITHHYQVTYTWNGFFAPAANADASQLNLLHAGDVAKLGFSLNGDRGLNMWTSATDARGFLWTCARDANGNATSVTTPDAITTDIEHNANGQLTAMVRPPNHTGHRERDEWHYYSGGPQNGYLQSFVRDAGGLNLTTGFTHNSVGCVTQIVDPRGNDTQFFVNQLNQVVQVTSRNAALAGPPIRYLTNIYRDANNRVTSIDVQNKDEFGVVGANAFFTTSFGYDSLDHVTSMTREIDSGHTVTTQYFYNPIRDLTEIRSPLAVSAVQPDARVQYAYDERDLPFTSTAAPGSGDATRSTYSYDVNGNLITVDMGAPAGSPHTVTATYDGFDGLSGWTSPVGTQMQLGRNNKHQVTSVTTQGNFLDLAGNPVFGPLRGQTWVYDSKGLLVQRVDDWFDPITSANIAGGTRTNSYSYDSAGNLISDTDGRGVVTHYTYDAANRLNSLTDPKGNRVDYTYDADGNLVTSSRTDKSDTAAPDQLFTVTYVYDGLNRLATSTDNVPNARSYLYDSRSNLLRYVDPRNNLTQYEYDGLSRLLRSGRDMNGNSSGFDLGTDIISGQTWDDNSRMIGTSDPNSHATQYQYDALSRLVQRTNADTTIKTWSYDPWGNVTQSTDENGSTCFNGYDDLNRLGNRLIFPGAGVSNVTTLEVYDYPGDYFSVERAISNSGTVRYTYDSLGRVLSETLNNRTTTYTHDGAGNLLTLASPAGRVVAYSYDTANLCSSLALTSTSDGDSLGTMANYVHIGRRLESVTHRNGTSTAYTYDGFVGAPAGPDLGWGRVAATVTTGPGPTALDQRTFSYDADGNLIDRNDTRPGGPQLSHHYDYDPANRNTHTTVTAPGPTTVRDTTYNYDLNGNRLSVNGPGTPNPGNYTQNAITPAPADAQMNQYTTTPLGGYQYDANGNRQDLVGTSDHFSYKYDYRNQLIDITNVATGLRVATYQYDGLGRRIVKTLDPDGTPNVTNFFYSGTSIIEERDGAGAVQATFTTDSEDSWNFGRQTHTDPAQLFYTGALVKKQIDARSAGDTFRYSADNTTFNYKPPIEMRRGGTNSTYHVEMVPWIWLVTNSSGGAAERYDYDDFGLPQFFDALGTPLTQSAIGNPYLFKRMRFDSESRLYTWSFGAGPRQTIDLTACFLFDPTIGASLQRESSHAVNGWSGGPLIHYYTDPWAWTGTDGWIPIPIDP